MTQCIRAVLKVTGKLIPQSHKGMTRKITSQSNLHTCYHLSAKFPFQVMLFCHQDKGLTEEFFLLELNLSSSYMTRQFLRLPHWSNSAGLKSDLLQT
jgi:hypothetical protein